MTHRFDFYFGRDGVKETFNFYPFTYRDFKYHGLQNMEEFQKEEREGKWDVYEYDTPRQTD